MQTVRETKKEAADLIKDRLLEAAELATGDLLLNQRITARHFAEELAEAAITYLSDYLARELHDAANAAEQWLESLGAKLDTWEVAEEAAAEALGNY